VHLAEPDPRYHASYVAALDELAAEGDARYFHLVLEPEERFTGVSYTGQALADPETFRSFCDYTRALAFEQTPKPATWVTGTYLWMVESDEVVGRISLRHELTPWLREFGGHIGYAVRPTARRRGHASKAVALMLPLCAERGLEQVLITCDVANSGSRRVIEANGGMLEDVRNGKLRYWVPTR
jgi:predicted acetyltransferase